MLTSSPSQRKTQQFGAVENRAKQKPETTQTEKALVYTPEGWLQINSSAILLGSINHGKY